MAKIDDIKKKSAEINEEIQRVRLRREAKRLGFDDLDDYKLWHALEEMRESNLALRRENARGNGQEVTVGPVQVGRLGGLAA